MIAMQVSRSSAPIDRPLFSRSSNAATAALPLIPRRTSSSISRSRSAPPSLPKLSIMSASTPGTAAVEVVVQQSTPPSSDTPSPRPTHTAALSDDSDTSSTSSSSSGERRYSKSKTTRQRRRGRYAKLLPPECSTPTPAIYNARSLSAAAACSYDADITPRPSTRHVHGYHSTTQTETSRAKPRTSENFTRASTESPAPVSLSLSVTTSSNLKPQLVRKKSGQLVKSSLKPSKSLSIIPSKSEPATPTLSKVVHFDTQLEHVKLFLAEQKPLAVSRDGSPTADDNTSGTDSDFPSFIFGPGSGDRASTNPTKTLLMRMLNMPPWRTTHTSSSRLNIALEDLVLSAEGTNVVGRIRARNIAYAKWVTVRFTFDAWQTTSEVTAKWIESINRDFDRFTFLIRLNDLLARIEGKRLYLAIRYIVAGMEFWDNNGGQNYVVSFTRVTAEGNKALDKESQKKEGDELSHLKSKLKDVMDRKLDEGRAPSVTSHSETPSLLARRSLSPAAARPRDRQFHFSTDPDELWMTVPSVSTVRPPRVRTQTYPSHNATATPTQRKMVPWSLRENTSERDVAAFANLKGSPHLGSPRDADDELLFSAAYCLPADVRLGGSDSCTRQDINQDDYVTPKTVATCRFPRPTCGYGSGIDSLRLETNAKEGGDEGWMTKSLTSSPSEPLQTDSHLNEYRSTNGTGMPLQVDGALKVDRDYCERPDLKPIGSGANYRQFLNKYCFFTSSDQNASLDVPTTTISRTHSASDIEELLSGASSSTSPSTPSILDDEALCGISVGMRTPSRSPSLDDVAVRSGSVTPMASAVQARHFREDYLQSYVHVWSSSLLHHHRPAAITISPGTDTNATTLFSESRSLTPIAT